MMVIHGVSLFYIVNFIFLLSVLIIQCYIPNRKFSLFLVLTNVIFVVTVSGMRTSGGTDLHNYIQLWSQIKPFSIETHGGDFTYWEPGFRYLVSVIKGIWNQEHFYLFIMALTIHFLLVKSIIKLKGNPIIALYIFYLSYFVSYSFNAVGQAVTMVGFIFLLPYIYERRILIYFSIIFAMTFFHKSILLTLPVLIASKLIKNIYIYIVTLMISLALYKLKVLAMLGSILGIDMGALSTIYGESTVSLLDFVQRLVLLYFCYLCVVRCLKTNFDWFVLKIYAAAFPFYIALLELPIVATRVHIFFRILEIVVLSRTYETIIKRVNKLLYLLIITMLYIPAFYIQITHPDSIIGF
jgi:hypothetical protein